VSLAANLNEHRSEASSFRSDLLSIIQLEIGALFRLTAIPNTWYQSNGSSAAARHLLVLSLHCILLSVDVSYVWYREDLL
jgi:hypothetical protein